MNMSNVQLLQQLNLKANKNAFSGHLREAKELNRTHTKNFHFDKQVDVDPCDRVTASLDYASLLENFYILKFSLIQKTGSSICFFF